MSETLPLVRPSVQISPDYDFRWDGVSATVYSYSGYWNLAADLWNERSAQRQFENAPAYKRMIPALSFALDAVFWIASIILIAREDNVIHSGQGKIVWIVFASLVLFQHSVSLITHLWNFTILMRTGGATKLLNGGCTYTQIPAENVHIGNENEVRMNRIFVITARYNVSGVLEDSTIISSDDRVILSSVRARYHIQSSELKVYGQVYGYCFMRRLGRIWKQCLGQLLITALLLIVLAATVQRYSIGATPEDDMKTRTSSTTTAIFSTIPTMQ